MDESLAFYKKAIELDPSDQDAKINFELKQVETGHARTTEPRTTEPRTTEHKNNRPRNTEQDQEQQDQEQHKNNKTKNNRTKKTRPRTEGQKRRRWAKNRPTDTSRSNFKCT